MRPLTATIHLQNLQDNFRFLKQQHGNQLYAVVKADAYGHGAIKCAQALAEDADGFAVAFLDEGIELRKNGISAPIVLLEGVFSPDEYAECDRFNLSPVVQNQTQLREFMRYAWRNYVTVWLKLDSGMRRAGFMPADYAVAYHAISRNKAVQNIVKMTHLSCADDLQSLFTNYQNKIFDTTTQSLGGLSSVANSAGILAHPKHTATLDEQALPCMAYRPLKKKTNFQAA
ncbi:MAG: alanine racemase [Neisseriaceae bacterium]|nr:alanine racemase [Neisseriaceae bacterium]